MRYHEDSPCLEHEFMDFAAAESAALRPDAWDIWIDRAEKIAGHDLDGDEFSGTDRYSLDSAMDAFEAGKTPAEYVAGFRSAAYVNPYRGEA